MQFGPEKPVHLQSTAFLLLNLPSPASICALLHDILSVPILHCMHVTGNQCLVDYLQGYLPAQLYNLNSCYGNKEQLQSLTWALNYAGIKPVADIVINHRCADVQNAEGIWNSYRHTFIHPTQFSIHTGNAAQCQHGQHCAIPSACFGGFHTAICRQMWAMARFVPKALLCLTQRLKICDKATFSFSSSLSLLLSLSALLVLLLFSLM